jgi:peptidoglycan hydrolase CwlO-like protein
LMSKRYVVVILLSAVFLAGGCAACGWQKCRDSAAARDGQIAGQQEEIRILNEQLEQKDAQLKEKDAEIQQLKSKLRNFGVF